MRRLQPVGIPTTHQSVMVAADGTSPQSNLWQLSRAESANKSQVRALIKETQNIHIFEGHSGIFHSLVHNRLNSEKHNDEIDLAI